MANIPEPPEDLIYLWVWLCEMTYPLTWTELKDWQEMTGRKLKWWEAEAMMYLDGARQSD